MFVWVRAYPVWRAEGSISLLIHVAKAERGRTVRNNRTGKVGVIQSVVGGVARVIYRDKTSGYAYSTDLSSTGRGCAVILAVPVLTAVMGVSYAWYSTSA